MPIAASELPTASVVELYGGYAWRSPASNPSGYPASARSRLARAGLYGSGSMGSARVEPNPVDSKIASKYAYPEVIL
jgi:hypothetical protein